MNWDYWNFTLAYSIQETVRPHREHENSYMFLTKRGLPNSDFSTEWCHSPEGRFLSDSTWAKPFSALRKMQPVRKWINPTKQLLEFDQQYHSGGLRVTSGCSHHNKDVGKEDQVKHKRCVLDDQLDSSYLYRLFSRAPCQWKGMDKVCSLYGGLNTHSRKSMEMENEKDERNGDGWTQRQRARWFGEFAICMKICQLEARQEYFNFTNARHVVFSLVQKRNREIFPLSDRMVGFVCEYVHGVCVHITCQMSFSTRLF